MSYIKRRLNSQESKHEYYCVVVFHSIEIESSAQCQNKNCTAESDLVSNYQIPMFVSVMPVFEKSEYTAKVGDISIQTRECKNNFMRLK